LIAGSSAPRAVLSALRSAAFAAWPAPGTLEVLSGRPEKGRGILESPVMDEMKRTLKTGLMFPIEIVSRRKYCCLYPVAVRSCAGPIGPAVRTCCARSICSRTCNRTCKRPAMLPQAVTDAAREQDAIFLQLREAARQNDAAKAAELAARLPDYAFPRMSTIIGSNRA
jgi:hypothetical protein